MSSSRPVPACRLPNSGERYQELYHGCAPSAMALDAMFAWSPSDIPSGPKAATEVTSSERRAGLAAGLGDASRYGGVGAAATGAAADGDTADGEASVGWLTA